MSVVSSFGELLASFFPLMTAPSSQNFVTVASGWILTPGRRTITQLTQCYGRASALLARRTTVRSIASSVRHRGRSTRSARRFWKSYSASSRMALP